jgi:hypothetical protein
MKAVSTTRMAASATPEPSGSRRAGS